MRYQRQTMLPEIGELGQMKLSKARVLIVGIGGLGAPVALYLAGAGVGTLVLADPDTVSLSNLQRQILYSENEVGEPKTECARKRLHSLNSTVAIELVPGGLTYGNAVELIADCDIVVDCTDNYSSRFLIDDVCHAAGVPWIHGSIGEFCGQAALFGGKSGRRFCELYNERDELCSLPRRVAGVLGPVPGVIGSLQACQAILYLVNGECALDGHLFTIDIKTLQTNIIEL